MIIVSDTHIVENDAAAGHADQPVAIAAREIKRAREMGLGSTRDVSLAEARVKAQEQRKLLLAGIDPLVARDARAAQARIEAAKLTTFQYCAEGYIKAHRAGWRVWACYHHHRDDLHDERC